MPAETRPDAVLWDMDGTLVDSEKLWTVAIADTARWLGGELSAGARAAMVGSNVDATVELLFADLGLPMRPDLRERTLAWMNRRTAELFGGGFAGGLEWRPGAREALRTVAAAGWPAALVTNTAREHTEMALDTIGREYFAVSVCGDEVSRGKPDPEPYRRAAELLGVAPERCLAVEDSPTGALAAERAGAAVLVVPCEVPVRDGPGRVLRASLVGLTGADLAATWAAASASRAAA